MTLKRSTKPLKRSPFARTGILALASNQRLKKAASTKKPKRIKHGKIPPTAAESAWMAWIANFGCVVCYLHHGAKTPAAVHYLVAGGRRLGHLETISLCDPGHHQNSPGAEKISRHPHKARFEYAYGDEAALLAYLRAERSGARDSALHVRAA